jgi:serine/threonine protein kinase
MNGGKKGEFAAILNECVQKCADLKEDYRYVKVCAEFAEFCKNPLEFLAWMERSSIGVRYSIFWETKARLLEEMARDTAGADAAFAEGIRRTAQPVDRLHAKRREMQARVAARLTHPVEGQQEEEEQEKRMALGSLAKVGMVRSTRAGPGQLKIDGPVAATFRRDLTVYEGSEEREESSSVPGRDWIDYGSERESVKENKDVAKQWSRTTLPQQAPKSGPSQRPAFAIFDDVKGVEEDVPVSIASAVKKPAVVTINAKAKASVMQAGPAPPSPVSKKDGKKAFRAGFNENALMEETLTFEELRAMQWFDAVRAEEEMRVRIKLEAEERHRHEEEARQRMRREADERQRLEQARQEEEMRQRFKRESEERQRREEAEQEEIRRAQVELQRAVREKNRQQAPSTMQMSFAVDNVAMDTMNYEALVRNSAKTGQMDMLDDLRNVYADTVDFARRVGGDIAQPTINTRAVMEEVERMFNENVVFDDDSIPAGPVSSRSFVSVAPPPGFAGSSKGQFDIYEDEDSLESFRASMNASAAISTAAPSAAPSAASFHLMEDSFVVPLPKPAVGKSAKIEVFQDEVPQKIVSKPALKSAKFEIFNDEPAQKTAPKSVIKSAKLEVFDDEPVQKTLVKSVAPKSTKLEVFEENAPSKSVSKPAIKKFEIFEDAGLQKSVVPVLANGPVDPWASMSLSANKISSLSGFHDHGPSKPRFEDDGKYFWLGEAVYDLLQIGGGVSSNVFRGEDVSGSEEDSLCAIKIFKPANSWEFYIISQLQTRCQKEQLRHFPRVLSYHHFAGQSALLTCFNENGTVANLMDAWKSSQDGVPEELCVFYAVELLRVVEALHTARVLHNDITPENVLLSHDASNMPDKQSLQLIDFSCAIDLTEFGGQAVFTGAGRCSVMCPQMRREESWTFQQDYFGIVNFCHLLIFGTPLASSGDVSKMKNGWQTVMWEEFFGSLLKQGPTLPAGKFEESAATLKRIRIKLETYRLQISNILQKLLSRQAILLFEKEN